MSENSFEKMKELQEKERGLLREYADIRSKIESVQKEQDTLPLHIPPTEKFEIRRMRKTLESDVDWSGSYEITLNKIISQRDRYQKDLKKVANLALAQAFKLSGIED